MLTIAKHAGSLSADVRLGVKGLTSRERQLLEGLVRLSERDTRHRALRIELVSDKDLRQADMLLLDGQDPATLLWARQQGWLADKPVIWLDVPRVAAGHTLTRRPVQWPVLPLLLSRALENGPHAAHPQSEAKAEPRPAPDKADKRPHVLLVDDSPIARTQLRNLVALRGCDTTDAASVEEGLALVASGHYDMVFMDVMMPGIDGYEGCRNVKATSRATGALPVVMLTSKSSPFDRIRGKIAGCDAYLTKPVEATRLEEVLAQYAPGSHSIPPLMVRQPQHTSQPVTAGGSIAGAT